MFTVLNTDLDQNSLDIINTALNEHKNVTRKDLNENANDCINALVNHSEIQDLVKNIINPVNKKDMIENDINSIEEYRSIIALAIKELAEKEYSIESIIYFDWF